MILVDADGNVLRPSVRTAAALDSQLEQALTGRVGRRRDAELSGDTKVDLQRRPNESALPAGSGLREFFFRESSLTNQYHSHKPREGLSSPFVPS